MPGSVTIDVTPELDPYVPAQEVRVSLEVRDIDGELVDPGALTLKVLRPDGAEVDLTYSAAQLVKDGTGLYHYDLLLSSSFSWRVRAEATNPTAASEKVIPVSDSPFVSDLPPVPGPGAGNEGRIARVTGGVYVPYAGGADEQPLVWRTATGWVGQALNLAAAAAVSGLLAISHIAPGANGQVLATSGGVTAWVNSSSIVGGAGGGNGEVQYNNAGALDGATGIKVVSSESEFAFGGTATTGGVLNVPHGRTVSRGRNNAGTGNVDLWTWGAAVDTLWVGDSSGLAAYALLLKTGGTLTVNVNGTAEYQFDSTQLNWNGNNSVGAGFYSVSGIVATSGFFRGPNSNTPLLSGRNALNTQNIAAVAVATDNGVYVGDSANSSAVYLTTSGNIGLRPTGAGSDSITISSSIANFRSVPAQWGTNPSAQGNIRLPSSTGVGGVWFRNNLNTADIVGLFSGNDDVLYHGDITNTVGMQFRVKTAGNFVLVVNGTTEYVIDAAALTMNGNNLVMGAGAASFGATPAAGGDIRGSATFSISGRNAANSADRSVLRWGITNTDEVALGSVSAETWVHAATTLGFFIAGVTAVTFSTSIVDFKSASLKYGTNPAGSGFLRSPNNVVVAAARDAINANDLNLVATDSSNNAIFGMSTFGGVGGATIVQGTDSGTGGVTIKVISAGPITSTLVVATTGATFGMRANLSNGAWIPHTGTVTARNFANTNDQEIISYGVAANDRLRIGQGAGSLLFALTNTAFFGGTPAAKQTVTGSKGANAALGSLLTALATYGLLTDSST